MSHRILLLLLLIIATAPVIGQPTTGGLGVANLYDFPSLDSMMRQSRSASPDTAKVRLLMKISVIYWARRGNRDMDSCLLFATAAHRLSAAIHDVEGNNDAIVLMGK